MKKFTLLFSVLCLSMSLLGESLAALQAIKDDSRYIWGEGTGNSLKEADQEALQSLSSLIRVDVSGTTDGKISNVQSGEEATSTTEITSNFRQKTNVILDNCKRAVYEEKGFYRVVRYIRQSDIDKVYVMRETKINDLLAQARKAEENMKIGDALRFYYWSLKLIASLPDARQMNLKGKGEQMLYSELSDHVTEIMSEIVIRPVGKTTDEDGYENVEMEFLYKGDRIVCQDFKFNNGSGWVGSKVKDGIGVAELPGQMSRVNIRLEYEYKNLWKSDPMVEPIMQQNPQTIAFPASNKAVSLSGVEKKITHFTNMREASKMMRTDSLGAVVSEKDAKQQVAIVYPVVDAIETKKFDGIEKYFTPDGWKWYEKLIKFGNAHILEKPELQITAFQGGYLVRGVTARFSFDKHKARFVEDLVFYVKDGLINAVNFGLEYAALQDLKNHGSWDEQSRLVLINFLENYKTAYALERLDYLDAVFSDDALIIVGVKVPQKTKTDIQISDADAYKYIRQTKGEYMENLKRVFAKQEFVNIHFEDASVKKTNPQKERYQILIKQIYSSASYADTGYLFLLADLSEPEKPVIDVRVWDFEKNKLMKYGKWNY